MSGQKGGSNLRKTVKTTKKMENNFEKENVKKCLPLEAFQGF